MQGDLFRLILMCFTHAIYFKKYIIFFSFADYTHNVFRIIWIKIKVISQW